MKVLFLTTHLNAGGITSYLLTLSKGLMGRGDDVSVLSSGGNSVDNFTAIGANHFCFDIKTKSELSPKIYLSLGKIKDLISSQGIEVLHAQTRITQVMGDLLSRDTKLPYVSTCHGFFKPRISRKLFPCWGDRVIAISPQVKTHLLNDFSVPDNKVTLIRNGIDIEAFPLVDERSKNERQKEKGVNSSLVIGIIARLSDVKGHAVLIKAMNKVIKDIPDALLVIVGEGKMGPSLKEQVSALGLSNNVRFFPSVNQTQEFLSLFDIFVMPSLQEGLGLSVMEAQAAGLPVIASRVGGLPSLIENDRTGMLVEPQDPEGLAQAIIYMNAQKEKARHMGLLAREFIKEEGSAQKMAEQTAGVYEQLIREKDDQ